VTPFKRICACSILVACVATLTLPCSSLAAATSEAGSAPVVTTSSGTVEGMAENGLLVFKGIPYAAAPVGEARWKPPQPAAHWEGVLKAKDFGPACMAPSRRIESIYSSDISPFSEDCLTLNVWAPADAAKAPVFLWIHGGALVNGSSKESLYDGARLARTGLVVVSINYRLGVFGFLAHPELSAESPLGISGNYGILDQVAALRWVQANIESFGGDPSNVTIAGESAGGLSVMFLLASPEARGLFAKAVAQSAYMVSMQELKETRHGTPSAEAAGAALTNALGLPDLESMRAKDAQELADAAAAARFLPMGTVDGKILPRQLVDTFDLGEQAPVPILTGFNSGEIRSLKVLAPPVPASAVDYENTIRERYVDLADEFLRLYPSADMQESIYATTRDALYAWTSERLARKQTELGQPSFLYMFDHGYPAADAAGLHAHHASELPYMWGNLDRTPAHWPKIPDTVEEHRFAQAMVDYWGSFARDGQPTAAGQPDWPAYGSRQSFMLLGDTPQPSEDLLPGMYELNETVVCRRRANGEIPWHWNVGLISPPLPAGDDLDCP
jgi:para-nitrobenzyl esterase